MNLFQALPRLRHQSFLSDKMIALIGVSAIVARFWTYHLRYDDLLILLPMIAFFRIAKGRSSFRGGIYTAGILLFATTLTLLAPGGTNFLPVPLLKHIYVAMQLIIWLTGLVFLVHHAHRERNHPSVSRRS